MKIASKIIESYTSIPRNIQEIFSESCDDRALKIGLVAVKAFATLLLGTSLTVAVLGGVGLSAVAGAFSIPVVIGAVALVSLGFIAILGASLLMSYLAQDRFDKFSWVPLSLEIT